MNTEMLLNEFNEILELEKKAKAFYDHYIGEIEDESIKKQLTAIRDDEICHIKIAEKLIELVS